MTCSESSVEVPVTVCVAIGVATRRAGGTSGPTRNASSRVSTVPAMSLAGALICCVASRLVSVVVPWADAAVTT